MTIEEAIYHLQELSDSKFEQMRRYDRASGYAISHNEDIRTADAKRLEQRAKECIQLAKWLKDYKKLLGAIEDINADIYKTSCFYYGSQIGEGLEMALHTIDRHLRRKEEE